MRSAADGPAGLALSDESSGSKLVGFIFILQKMRFLIPTGRFWINGTAFLMRGLISTEAGKYTL